MMMMNLTEQSHTFLPVLNICKVKCISGDISDAGSVDLSHIFRVLDQPTDVIKTHNALSCCHQNCRHFAHLSDIEVDRRVTGFFTQEDGKANLKFRIAARS